METTSCYCYFMIRGDFNPIEISDKLNIKPTEYWSVGDLRGDGSRHTFAMLQIGYILVEHPNIEVECLGAVKDLIGKEQLLNEIRSKHDVTYTVEIVPSIYEGISPVINFGNELLTFCAKTNTDIDLDMYVYPFAE